eukprot:262929_1
MERNSKNSSNSTDVSKDIKLHQNRNKNTESKKPNIIEYDELTMIISRKRNQKQNMFKYPDDTEYIYYPLFLSLKDHSIDYECLSGCICAQQRGQLKPKSQFIEGYKLERKRMFDIKQQCTHNTFSSVSSLMNRLKYLMHGFATAPSIGHIEDIKDELHQLFGTGNCNNCCIYLLSHLFQITDKKVMDKAGVWLWSIDANYQPKNSWTLALITSIMQYPHLCDFVWNYSHVRVLLLNELVLSLKNLTIASQMERERLNDPELINHPDARFWIGEIDYCSIALLQLQLMRNFKLIRKKEWYSIMVTSIYLKEWMVFVLEQLKLKIFFQTEFQRFGNTVMMNFVYIITYAFGLLLKYPKWRRILKKTFKSHHFDISNWFEQLEKLYITEKLKIKDPVHLLVLCWLICLKNEQFVTMQFEEIYILSRDIFKVKWYEIECHNHLCVNRRFMVNKFYKCKQCKVAIYCSKKCQKMDWNNMHRINCDGKFKLIMKVIKGGYQNWQYYHKQLLDKFPKHISSWFTIRYKRNHALSEYNDVHF